MNHSSTKVPFMFAAALAAIALNVTAELKVEPKSPMASNVGQNKKGAIVEVSQRGKTPQALQLVDDFKSVINSIKG